MTSTHGDLDIFLVVPPGLEGALRDEARAKGFKGLSIVKGGVIAKGGWKDVWRANLELRGAGSVIARFATFRASHLSELDKRAHRVPWGKILRKDKPFRVEVSCKSSRIYHSGAAAQRIERAIREELGAPFSADAEITIKARIENDLCTIGVDTSGDLLHRRGHKQEVNKAPMRETMAALFLQLAGYDGHEPVVDPMCGSGTFVIEAAEIAAGLLPGRSRHFALEDLANFDEGEWQRLRDAKASKAPSVRFYGSDHDAGAIRMSRANAARAGVGDFTEFRECAVSDLVAPGSPSGLVIVNPPYGDRIGDKKRLGPLYRSLGLALKAGFSSWRIAVITNEASLAAATGLPFGAPIGPIAHGGLRVSLYLTKPLKA